MSKYPDYACQCCGYTNGDMFEDKPGKRTDVEIAEFSMYRKMYHAHKEELRQAERPSMSIWPKTRIGQRHTEATRQKISATIRAKNAKLTEAEER